ncbi:MAG: saccharopine dehydrogenase family protein [Thermoanaerobaculia bacterium]
MSTWLLYGANGYTGRLIADEAVRRGERPILAGRNAREIESMARALSLEARVFALDENASSALDGVAAVLHAAGPFAHTSAPMLRACIASRAHYLDITGEISVFESIFARDAELRAGGITAIPGVGFDVVPTDCLASRLHARMPDATALALAFCARGGMVSAGTMKTMIEGIPSGGAIRRDGTIVRVPTAWDVREIPFSCGTRTAMTIPWGDIATAFRTTGIPNIRTYTAAHPKRVRMLRGLATVAPLLRIGPLRAIALAIAGRRRGADEATRANSRVFLWGEAIDTAGNRIEETAETPDGYSLTARASVEAVRRVLRADALPGAWTPAQAFGASFLDEILSL